MFSTIYVLIALYLANGSYYTCMYTFFLIVKLIIQRLKIVFFMHLHNTDQT